MWDSTTKFHVEESKLHENSVTLVIQLRKNGPFCLDKDAGEIHIPLKKLFGDPKNDIVNNKRYNLGVYIVTASGTTDASSFPFLHFISLFLFHFAIN